MEEEIKIGDIVVLLNTNNHNSSAPEYKNSYTFSQEDIGSEIVILDIIELDLRKQSMQSSNKKDYIDLAYKVECPRGITYLRRKAFEFKYRPYKEEKEDYNYLTDYFTKYNIV